MDTAGLRKRVILVDDDPITNMIHTKMIKRECGCDVEAFTHAHVVLDLLKLDSDHVRGGLPEVLLLDINMPGVDGWAFLAEFERLPAEHRGRCRIFVVSSSIDRDDEAKSKNYPSVRGFFSKPLSREMIRTNICP